MKFRGLRKQVLSEEIVKEMLSMIESGEISPGDKLPPERELAAILNVIEIAKGDGIYVTTLDPEQLAQHLEFIFSLEDSTFLQMFEARRIMEAGCAELAAERAQDDDISAIESTLVETIDSLDNTDRFVQIDIGLHDRIAQFADNPMLSRFLGPALVGSAAPIAA
jgi:GntR family transcriptional repressor for pyruvate dehydrogenase complex